MHNIHDHIVNEVIEKTYLRSVIFCDIQHLSNRSHQQLNYLSETINCRGRDAIFSSFARFSVLGNF